MHAAHVLDVLASPTQGPARVFISSEPAQQHRPSSARSEGAASLSRRSRVRRKPSSQRGDDVDSSSDFLSSTGDLSSGQLFVHIPPEPHPSSSPQSGGTFNARSSAPPRPIRSPKRLQPPSAFVDVDVPTQEAARPRPRTRSTDGREDRGRATLSEEEGHSRRLNKPRGLSLPRHAFRSGSLSDSSEQPSPLTPNAFTDVPPMPAFARNRPFRHHPRDSNATQQSTASSSLYPKSTSTESSLPSPVSLSMHEHEMDDRLIIADPDDDTQAHLSELEGLNQDDVSYRLRLLMQNNYYLPPAHSKPFKDVVSADAARRAGVKSNSPTALLDLLKGVGKKRSAYPPDQRSFAPTPTAPMLRATNDSSTMSGILRPVNAQSSADLSAQVRLRDESKKGRVVVVREQMHDLERIAQQVEQELKIREAERHRQGGTDSDSHSDKAQKDVLIDPTDFVDLPMLPADTHTLFGMNAADLSRMPVDAFVNAALLADQLPPASPGWSNSCDDSGERDRTDSDALWRKAVLLAAVNHSLNNSPANTPSRSRSGSGNHLATDLPSPYPTSPSPKHLSPLSPPSGSPLALAPVREAVKGEVTLDSTAQDSRSKSALTVSVSKDTLDGKKKQRIIGQRIISQLMDENDLCDVPAVPPKDKGVGAPKPVKETSPAFQAKKRPGVVDLVSTDPQRSNSPTVTATPLLPPPRHHKTGSITGQSAESQATSSDKTMKAVDRSDAEASQSQLQVQEIEVQGRLSDVYERNTGTSRSVGETTVAASASPHAVAGQLTVTKKVSGASFTRTNASSSSSHYSDEDSGDEEHCFHTPKEYPGSAIFASSRPSLASTRADSYNEPLKSGDSLADVFAADLNESVYLDGSHRSDSVADSLNGRSRSLSIANTLGPRSRTVSRASTVERNEMPQRKAVISPPPRTSSAFAVQNAPLRPSSPVRRTATSPLPARPSITSVDDFVPGSSYDEPETPKASGSSPTVRELTLTVPRLTVNVQGASAFDAFSPTAFFDAFEAQSHEEDDVDDDDEEAEEEEEDEAQDEDTLQPLSPLSLRSFEGRRSDVSSDLVSLDPRTGSMHNVAYPHQRTHLAPFMQQRNASSPQLGHDYLLSPSDSASMTGSVKSGRSLGGRGFWGLRLGKSRNVDVLGTGVGGSSMPRASESSVDRVQKERHLHMHAPIENLRNASSDAFGQDDTGGVGGSSSSVANVPVGTNTALNGLLERHMLREKEVLRRIATSHTSKSGSSK